MNSAHVRVQTLYVLELLETVRTLDLAVRYVHRTQVAVEAGLMDGLRAQRAYHALS